MSSIYYEMNVDNIFEGLSKINDYIKNPIYKNLKNDLNKVTVTLESFAFYKPELEKNIQEGNKGDKTDSMYPQNFFKGQHILIAMFFSSDLKYPSSHSSSFSQTPVFGSHDAKH